MGVHLIFLHTGRVRTGLKAFAVGALALALAGFGSIPAGAVTYGAPVSNAGKTAPWVVRILFADTGVPTQNAYLICSGSLLDSRTVLTAGHCVADSSLASGYYYIQSAATANGPANRVPVDASWYNPNFDPGTLSGDVALLHLARPIKVSQYAQLPTSSLIPRALHLYGFGENESQGLPGQLWTTPMHPASISEINRLGGYNIFNSSTMLAAVNFRKAAGVYSGGCHGDSGGPLSATIHGKPVIFGVVSWGQPECVGTASAFARVSALVGAIRDGRAMLPSLAQSQYRARPENSIAPSISGWPASAGGTLTCHPGSWTSHPGAYSYRWYTQDAVPGTDPSVGKNASYVVSATDVRFPIQCVVIATSALNANNSNIATATVNAYVKPVIESVGIDNGGSIVRQVGSVWTCTATAGGLFPVTSLLQSARTFTWTASNGAVLPHTKHLTWTSALITAIPPGTALSCTLAVTNAHSAGTVSTGTSPTVVVN